MYKFTLVILLLFNTTISAQAIKKWSIGIEGQLCQITSSAITNRALACGSLSVDYRFTNKFYAGGFLNNMRKLSSDKMEVFLIRDKIVDISNVSFTNFGITLGYEPVPEDNISITPEMRLGYGLLSIKSPFANAPEAENISKSMLTINPRALANFKITKGFSTGLSLGYLYLINLGGDKLPEYNLQNPSIGVFLKIRL